MAICCLRRFEDLSCGICASGGSASAAHLVCCDVSLLVWAKIIGGRMVSMQACFGMMDTGDSEKLGITY